VIIPTYNGKTVLLTCLDALSSQSFPDFDVIIVDNASSDGTREAVAAKYPAMTILRLPENYGFARAINAGIRAADSPMVLLLNNDAILDKNALAALFQALNGAPADFAAANPRVLLTDGRVDNIGIMLDKKWRASQIGWQKEAASCPAEPVEIFGANACASLFRKSFFDDVGLFDEDFFAYWEDVDLVIRGRLRGWRFLHVPQAVVHHRHSYTAANVTGVDKRELSYRNSFFSVLKNAPAPSLPRLILWHRIFRDLGNIVHFLKNPGGRGEMRAHFRTYLAVLLSLPDILRKRGAVQRGRRASLKEWLGRPFGPVCL
jgi:GT2 family glycosyltransferase